MPAVAAASAADKLGVQPGAEFRAAADAAAAVPGGQCCLVLGDRPIEITLSRTWEALSWQRRLALLGDLLASGMSASDKVGWFCCSTVFGACVPACLIVLTVPIMTLVCKQPNVTKHSSTWPISLHRRLQNSH